MRYVAAYLVLVCRPHVLDDFLGLGLRNATLLRYYLSQDRVDLASHVGRITADVDVSLLGQELVDLLSPLLQAVLDVDFFGTLSRKSGDKLELVAKNLLVFLNKIKVVSVRAGAESLCATRKPHLHPTHPCTKSPR